MASENDGPICMRVNKAERRMLMTMAAAQGMSLSAYVRSTSLKAAYQQMKDEGPEKIIKRVEDAQRQEMAEHLAQLEGLREALSNEELAAVVDGTPEVRRPGRPAKR